MGPGKVHFEDWQAMSEVTFEWADSYDSKQWVRLEAITAPHITLDYSESTCKKYDKIPRADFLINVTYRRWVDENRKEVEAKSEGLLIMTHHYVKIDGVWKLSGTTAHGRLGDLKLDKVFRGFA
ncbi:hypothetical protein BJY01DRAFT_244858 [Aspergillus pseudoustus]|uniref:Scytalone dehydratase-like domain-containing protein n=1 Tax=Aspergillus pseudoustus TaxID=1810923 RepID=A0ABR4KJE0_9EURO